MGGGANGSITLTVGGGTAPYTFLWSNGATTQNLNMLPTGCYNVIVIDAVGCSASSTTCISNLAGPILYSNSNPVSLFTIVNGGFTPQWVCANQTLQTDGGIMKIYLESGATMITGGGIDTVYAKSGSTISMSGGIHVIYHEPGVILNMSGGIPTLYLCPSLVFNYSQAPANGCVVVPNCNLTASTTSTDIPCNGQSSGSINLSTAGAIAPVSYQWSNGATTEDLVNIPAGTYTATITDANGCVVSQSAVVSQPVAFVASASVVSPIPCFGSTGTIQLTGTGGTAPYLGTGLMTVYAGTQNHSITDANGCTAQTTITITQPSLITTVTNTTDELMFLDGTASVVVNGGTSPYTYLWSPGGATTPDIAGLAFGSYTVTITDASGCIETAIANVGSQVGITSLESASALVIYPNPSADLFNISIQEHFMAQQIFVYTTEGRLLNSFNVHDNEAHIIDASNWTAGHYILKVIGENGLITVPMIKK